MPSGPTSAARVVVSPITAIFEAQYGVGRASGRFPLTDARLMMSPAPRSIIGRRNARHIRYMPRTLTANTSSQSSGSNSTSGATGPARRRCSRGSRSSRRRVRRPAPHRLGVGTSTSQAATRARCDRRARRPPLGRRGLGPPGQDGHQRRRRRGRGRSPRPRPFPAPVTSAVRPVARRSPGLGHARRVTHGSESRGEPPAVLGGPHVAGAGVASKSSDAGGRPHSSPSAALASAGA